LAAEVPLDIRPDDLDEFRRRLRRLVERELRRCLPVARDLEWRRRWNPNPKTDKTTEKAHCEVARWREAAGRPEDLPKKMFGQLMWLGARTLERTAPRDRRSMAEEFIHFVGARLELGGISVPPEGEDWWTEFDVRSGKLSSSSHPAVAAEIYRPCGFLEHELARIAHGFPRDLRNSLKQLPLLCRGQQAWFEERLAKKLEAAIRKMYPGRALLTKTRTGRLILEALLSERPSEMVRKLLKEVGWNQAAWAKEAGLHHTTINHLVAGKPLRDETLGLLIDKLEKKLKRVQLI
jgi:hypothetical protein